MAGKTGTTENYGDAWFVGYTPQLAVAVWVGYPTTLKPMLTEFHGEPVTGGSFPALIWKSFMEKALKNERAAIGFPAPAVPYVAPKLVVRRGDRLLLDNGLCRERREVVYFAGTGPSKTANCLENEVRCPTSRKLTLVEAQARVEAQPLTPKLVYKPANAAAAVGVVIDQLPKRGYRSSYDEIILDRHQGDAGRDPEPRRARHRRRAAAPEAAEARAEDHRAGRHGRQSPGKVLEQKPRAGLAAAPGVKVELVVSRSRGDRSGRLRQREPAST